MSGEHCELPRVTWIEEVFPPTFTLDDADDDYYKEQRPPGPSVYDQAAGRAPLEEDLDRIKNVYERVWLMLKIQEEEEERRAAHEVEPPGGGRSLEDTKLIKMLSRAHKMDGPPPSEGQPPANLHDSCIWDTDELSILRGVFKTAKSDNIRLRTTLTETQEQLAVLRQKYDAQAHKLESCNGKLQEAVKANTRLDIVGKTLKEEVAKLEEKLERLRKKITDHRNKSINMKKDNHELIMELDKERIAMRQLETDLQAMSAKCSRAIELREQELTVKYETECSTLRRTIRDLDNDLKSEKAEHERCVLGLEHLRRHFASLPDNDGTSRVTRDELSQFSY